MNNKPLVSIVCLTYNHEKYITQCLDSFLEQITNFSYEILIHDDASEDNTVHIIETYKQKYSDIIKPIYQAENQFSKGIGFVGLDICFKKAEGKYIAYCEGDDYWCNPLKLQKQVDFLEANSDFHVCTHDTVIKNAYDSTKDGVLFSKLLYNIFLKKTKQVYTIEDTFTGNIFHISSIFFRNKAIIFPKWVSHFSACDMVLFMLLAKEGKIFYMDDVMSVYRNNIKSLTSTRKEYSSRILFFKMSLNIIRLMNKHFKRTYQNAMYRIIARYYVEIAFLYLKKSNFSLSAASEMVLMSAQYDLNICLRNTLISIYNLFKRRLI